jgi:CubicO group peptidase (beta-lactamase class C family)
MEGEIKRMMRRYHLPALALTIVDGDKLIYQESRGLIDIDNNREARSESIFKLWSVAKVFTAVEIFREAEEGLIQLDAPISEYLPDFSIQSRFPDTDPITVRSLLAHRSGLPRNECLNFKEAGKTGFSLHKFEEAASACYLAYTPGFRYKYSNLNYDLLGRIIEENRGSDFADYMDEQLLDKLGMSRSTFSSGNINDTMQIALGYEYYKRHFYPMIQSDINSVPSGNLYASIEDLSQFLRLALNNELFDNKLTLKQMFVDHYSRREDPETMGLGWKTTRIASGELMVWHDGGPGEGIGALIAMLPEEKIGIAVVANSTGFSSNRSIPFVKGILKHLLEKRDVQPNTLNITPARYTPDKEILKDYEGSYIAFGSVMQVTAKKRKLKGKIGGINLSLIPISEHEFKVTHWMDKLGLTRIIQPPVDFAKIRVSFQETESPGSISMIFNLDNITYEICPRYPDPGNLQDKWINLLGEYQLAWREPGSKPGHFSGDFFSIFMENQVLSMSGVFGPILPLDESYIRILSGPFAGETMEYFPETGYLVHQNAVFVPQS